jgi:hypothetical protein
MESNSKRFGNKSESEIDARILQKIQRKFEIMCGGNSQFFWQKRITNWTNLYLL